MKTMFGKRYPNCVKKKKTKKEEGVVTEGSDGDLLGHSQASWYEEKGWQDGPQLCT